jgi:organic solute transporter Ostalpha
LICPTSSTFSRARLIIRIISSVSTAIAVVAVISFYRQMKPCLKDRRALAKLFVFKSAVILTTLELVIFTIIDKTSVVKDWRHLKFFDWVIGLPAVVIGAEMPIFALLFLWAFSVAPYRHLNSEASGQGGGLFGRWLRAVVDSLNITDIGRGLAIAVRGLHTYKPTARDQVNQPGPGAVM